ncbi:MAG: hypothetical protein EPN91_08530 [Salinibacterium sp.]|nr:MAG: hypothetical protein EPN91_08530 [Salinibacterium sp.]
MKTGGKVALGIAAAGVAGFALYSIFKRRSSGLIPSDPAEWSLPTFTTTQEFFTPAPPPPPPTTGTWRFGVEVIPIVPSSLNSSCTSSRQCGEGTVCINGTCRPEAEWNES